MEFWDYLLFTFLPVWFSGLGCWIPLSGGEGFGFAFAAWLAIALAAGVQVLLLLRCRRSFAKWIFPAVCGGLLGLSCLVSGVVFAAGGNAWLCLGIGVMDVFVWYGLLGAGLGGLGYTIYRRVSCKKNAENR